ncbi:hypothetical protein AMTR_s00046p00103460 [Amborella trichopoda]|uniref:Uncharacterized protein n=1 Tax=Amborella trichopoda TaxID=13333 RepID=U5CXC3_AMBTC|nr:hypothetical protein AMTR_s00046p00103460 [Amborella trichopoda]
MGSGAIGNAFDAIPSGAPLLSRVLAYHRNTDEVIAIDDDGEEPTSLAAHPDSGQGCNVHGSLPFPFQVRGLSLMSSDIRHMET